MPIWSDTYKPARVVIAKSLGVAKGFQQRVRLEYDVFDVLDLGRQAATRYLRNVAHYEFGRYCLAGATLPTDNDALVLVVDQQIAVHGV